MAKIKINNLPEGFIYKDDKVVEDKQSGGMMTGDQSNYGLVTTNPSMDLNKNGAEDIRYSISKVPRDEANVEAEGGETVLADLNNDGKFGLYDINGPRHANGGVPLYLPEQSFVFSDFNKLKFGKQEMAELGIESKKKKTPAKISKKFSLNEYYGKINDPYADKIQVESAELMMDKNKMKLSQLAFMQEAKKNFEDGVPYSSYPYLTKQGIDPVQFTQQVEKVTEKQAQEKVIRSLPMDQQMQIKALQEYMSQVDNQVQQDNQPQQQVQEEQQMQQQVEQLPKAQVGINTDVDDLSYNNKNGLPLYEPNRDVYFEGPYNEETVGDIQIKGLFDILSRYPNLAGDKTAINTELMFLGLTADDPLVQDVLLKINAGVTSPDEYIQQIAVKQQTEPVKMTKSKSNSIPKNTGRPKTNTATEGLLEYYKERGIGFEPEGVGELSYADTQKRKGTLYGDAKDNIEGFYNQWKDKYWDIENLMKAINTEGTSGELEEVKKFQDWFNDEYINVFAENWADQYIEKNYDKLDKSQSPDLRANLVSSMKSQLINDYGFIPGSTGRGFDSKFGTFSSSRRPFILTEEETEDGIKDTVKVNTPKKDGDKVVIEESEIEFKPFNRVGPEFWLQDKLKLNAIQRRKRELFLPYQPPVKDVDYGYVLEDPTRAIAALNEQYNIGAQAVSAFAGPQATSARLSGLAGKAAQQIANTIAGVNQRNVNTINRGNQLNARFDMMLNQEERKRQTKLYDDTNVALQNYLDEKNYDREQYANAYADAVTNMWQADQINKLNDYYQIRPSTGGDTPFIGQAAFQPTQQKTFDEQMLDFAEFNDKYGSLFPDGYPDGVVDRFFGQQSQRKNRGQQELRQTNPLDIIKNNSPINKLKGGSLKRYATPFYAGKIGM